MNTHAASDLVHFSMDALTSPAVRQEVATQDADIVALATGTNRKATELARGRGVRATRLKAIKDDIHTHIDNDRLSVTMIARRHRVTPRYVQLLFAGDGRTFSGYVIEQRLVRAHRMLETDKFADWTIVAIAFGVGFSNLSYFNRTFRRRYGATPSQVRAEARRFYVE